jgi:hypothetical protein
MRPNDLRQRAAVCLRHAEQATQPADKELFLRMAERTVRFRTFSRIAPAVGQRQGQSGAQVTLVSAIETC